MPNTREKEKLIELLDEASGKIKELCGGLNDHNGNGVRADHLIANGVTVQKWIPVSERLPEHGDVVLCFMKFGGQRILQWDNVSNWWLGYGHGEDWQKADVTHWCCLPQPPKGE